MATSYLDKIGLTYFWGKIKDYMAEEIPPKMTILSYGNSTWADFIAAYDSNTIVYCRASSNSNPASGNQTRMAFMAYINSTPPTEVQFQYYRSVSSHSATQQGDQVYIYKLNKNTGWSVTTREAMSKIAAGAGLSSSYSNGTITLSATNTPDLSNYVQKTDYATSSTAGVVKVDGTSIAINNGSISATGVFTGKVTAGSTASNPMDLVTLSQLQAALPSSLSSYYNTIGDGTTTSFTINHYLNTRFIIVSINITDNGVTYIAPNGVAGTNQIGYGVTINSADSITINFTSAPATNAAEVSIVSAIAYSSASDQNYLRIS